MGFFRRSLGNWEELGKLGPPESWKLGHSSVCSEKDWHQNNNRIYTRVFMTQGHILSCQRRGSTTGCPINMTRTMQHKMPGHKCHCQFLLSHNSRFKHFESGIEHSMMILMISILSLLIPSRKNLWRDSCADSQQWEKFGECFDRKVFTSRAILNVNLLI